MNATQRDLIMQRWNVIEHELFPELRRDVGTLTAKLEQVIHTLEWVRIKEFVTTTWRAIGRPPSERAWLANAFVAKAVLGLSTTIGLIERLTVDRALRRICGFPLCRKLPSEATFSRAFAEFAESRLPERVHERLIKTSLGDALIGHLSRDGTAIPARERPLRKAHKALRTAAKRGRPARGEARSAAKISALERQSQQTLPQMLAEIPTACNRGTKCNAQGYKTSWNAHSTLGNVEIILVILVAFSLAELKMLSDPSAQTFDAPGDHGRRFEESDISVFRLTYDHIAGLPTGVAQERQRDPQEPARLDAHDQAALVVDGRLHDFTLRKAITALSWMTRLPIFLLDKSRRAGPW